MNSRISELEQEKELRAALYAMYVSQFDQFKNCKLFKKRHAELMLGALMSAHPNAWRVRGITAKAFNVLQQHDFRLPARELQRGHIFSRAETAKILYSLDCDPDERKPFALEHFFTFYFDRDETIIMTISENKGKEKVPEYYRFENINDSSMLFRHNTRGWHYGEGEILYLRNLQVENLKLKKLL